MEAIDHDAEHESGDEGGADASDEHDEDEYFAGEKESVLQVSSCFAKGAMVLIIVRSATSS
ncbi:hypothetical protein DEO72_LG9g2041 [Vigna unguiculata]|uniref:Uncharacterized protein n=1 Tax=Vigna unguiculata TaxID=3917 RepID=A0A4D6MZX3_VIGUN|nr:hypothetical protein DEO72_LG8g1659 [Vigna unguiculata]QCE07026.1 hypothetical protein DEO72_LG9g2041 [Vigna unguiculata]